eukprot:NODE_4179_length_1104_cov_36.122324_g3981_i0.p1 GENE.NODE_4179_length_1104_cov_36.122324_g3981_i0~~NODE_4179_length_1104_cov_36.122324_g3981_i0.p1  ORF type:complete len:356 (-),score=68.96 NODE_4179_length_1104_cov_36.122324_g3981_i0:35-1048(-)
MSDSKRQKLSHTMMSVPRRADATFPRQRIFKGFFAPPVAPVDANGVLDVSKIQVYGEKLVEDGVDGVFCTGTLGEGASFGIEERKAMTKAWTDFAGPKESRTFKVIVHVGTQCVLESRALAQYAEECGADGIACMSPCLYKPGSASVLAEFFAQVASAAPKTPFLYYHCTMITGPTFRCLGVIKECEQLIPTFRGVKFTCRDYGDLQACLQYYPDLDIMPAYDDQFFMHCHLGAESYVTGSFNLITPLYKEVARLMQSGSLAEAAKVWSQITDFLERLQSVGTGLSSKYIPGMKWLTGLRIGTDLGAPRAPLPSLTSDEKISLATTLKEWGLADWLV